MKQITEQKDDRLEYTPEEKAIIHELMTIPAGGERALLAEQAVLMKRQSKLAEELARRDPSLGFTAFLIAGDVIAAERATELVRRGVRPLVALRFTGSYARFGWAVEHLSDADLFPRICALWQAADPDDSDPAYLALWRRAFEWNGHKTLRDGLALPATRHVKLWRGSLSDQAPGGIAWSRSKQVAERFAKGASYRRPTEGFIWSAWCERKRVLAYITGRGEQEIIADPETVTGARVEFRVVKVRKDEL